MADGEAIKRIPPEQIAALLLRSVEGYAIYTLDPGGHVVSWNPGAEKVKGYAEAEILGEHFSIFYTPEAREAGEPDRELLAAAGGRYETEGWRVRRDGTRMWANVVMTPILGDNGELLGFAKVTRDSSERRKAEESRLRLARAEEALRLRDEVVQHARRSLDGVLVTIRVHLDSLRRVTEGEGSESTKALANKIVMLEWGLDRLTQSVDRALQIASETGEKLARGLERPL